MEIAVAFIAVLGVCLLVAAFWKTPPRESPSTGAKKPTDAERRARAQSLGVVHRSEYLESEAELATLTLDRSGLPTAALEKVRDRLLIATKAGWVNPKSRSLGRVGLYSFQVRGSSYYEGAAKAADFRPGALLTLTREPENEHDLNAVAVYGSHGRKVGYVNKQNAAKIAKRMDAGEDIVAISTRGSGPRSDGTEPQILAAERRVMAHLTCRIS